LEIFFYGKNVFFEENENETSKSMVFYLCNVKTHFSDVPLERRLQGKNVFLEENENLG